MKKCLLLSLILMLCAALCVGCAAQKPEYGVFGEKPVGTPYKLFEDEVDNYPGVKLVVVEGTVTPTSAEVRIVNETGLGMTCYGDNYIRVQKEVDGAWYDLSFHNVPVNSRGPWQFDADVEYRETVNWDRFYHALSPGHYRIVKDCSVRTDSDRISLLLTAEFELK